MRSTRTVALVFCAQPHPTVGIGGTQFWPGYLRLRPGRDANSAIASGQVLYKYVRSPLLHEGDASEHIEFTDLPAVGNTGPTGDKFLLSSHLVTGLVLAVVGCKPNSRMRLPQTYVARVGKFSLDINDYWGNLPGIKKSIHFSP